MSYEQIKIAQSMVYKYLVDKNRVSHQIAESQAVSESMATIMADGEFKLYLSVVGI